MASPSAVQTTIAGRVSSARLRALPAWAGPALVALLAYTGLALHTGAADGFRFWKPLRVGSYATPEQLLPGMTADRSTGYDGQFYFYIAQDPFLRRPSTLAALDNGFRYRRILYPLLAWLLSLGQPAWLPVVMLAINVLAAAALIGLLGALAAARGRRPWAALLVGLSAGLWIPVLLDLTEPLQLLLMVAGLAAESAGLLFLAALAKETAVVAMATELLRQVRLREWRAAVWLALGVAAFGVWTVAAQLLTAGAPRHELTPGFLSAASPIVALAHAGRLQLLLLLPALGMVALALGRLVVARDGAALAAAASALVALGANPDAWSGPEGYYRILAPVPVLVFMSWCRSGDRAGFYCVLLGAGSGALLALALLI